MNEKLKTLWVQWYKLRSIENKELINMLVNVICIASCFDYKLQEINKNSDWFKQF